MKTNIHHNNHQPVLLQATLSLLEPQTRDTYLDLTAGYGGHAAAILARTRAPERAVLVDRDNAATEHLNAMFPIVRTVQRDFLQAARDLTDEGARFDVMLMDIGLSSPHLDSAERGFSIKRDGPLDMRMDRNQELNAHTIVNEWPEAQITQILRDFGEEPAAAGIAAAIVRARPIDSTGQLADVIKDVPARGRRSKLHPATKTFQALRIAVNDELEQLKETLPLLPDLLAPGGRLAIISFHSLEDRIIKVFLREESRSGYEARLRPLTKKPIRGDTEDVHNPRARSAKLRAAVKIKKERDTHAN